METHGHLDQRKIPLHHFTIGFQKQGICAQRKIPLHHFTIGFQKQGICADSLFLESYGKMVQWDFSLIKNRAPRGAGFLCPPGYTFYSAGSTPVSPNRHGSTREQIIPPEPARTCKLMRMSGSKKYSPVGTKAQPRVGLDF